jgi:hypothetical protein
LFKGYGAKVGLGNMRVKAENRMVTKQIPILYCRIEERIGSIVISIFYPSAL